jgi:hypothetical protein
VQGADGSDDALAATELYPRTREGATARREGRTANQCAYPLQRDSGSGNGDVSRGLRPG